MNCNDEMDIEQARKLMANMVAAVTFPLHLQMLRVVAGMSRLELAAKARMSVGSLSRLENGRSSPSPRVLARLIESLPMPPEQEGKFLELAARQQIEVHRPMSQQQAKFTPRPFQMPPMTPEEASALVDIMRKQPAHDGEVEAPAIGDKPGKAEKPPQRLFIAYPGCPPAVVAYSREVPTGSSR